MPRFRIFSTSDDLHKDVRVSSAPELVKLLHSCAFTQSADDQAYMEDVAERVADPAKGVVIRTHSAEAFVNDMVRFGMLEFLPDEVFPEEK